MKCGTIIDRLKQTVRKIVREVFLPRSAFHKESGYKRKASKWQEEMNKQILEQEKR